MGMGLQRAYGSAALAAHVRQRIIDQINQQKAQQEMALAQQRAGLEARSADRQDRMLDQNDQFRRDTLAETQRQHEAANADRELDNNRALNDQIPAGTFFEPQNPIVGRLQSVGGVQAQEERPRVDVGPLLPGDTGQEMKRGFLKIASQKQTVDATTRADKEADNARQLKGDADRRAHELKMEEIAGRNAGQRGESFETWKQRYDYELAHPKAASARAVTEGERKASGFHGQMEQSIKTIDELESKLTDKDLYQIQSIGQEGVMGLLNRRELSEDAKRYLQAFEQFTEARLRPVSGAAINDKEYARDRRTYARQYGETPALAAQRKESRRRALESLRMMGGGAIHGAQGGETQAPPDAASGGKLTAEELIKKYGG